METLPGLGRLPDVGDQGELLSVGAGPREIVGEVRNPVAHVHVELHQPHLDKVFDYLVPAAMDAAAVPGVRVSVDVAGLRASGFVVARDSASSTGGRLRPLRRVVSALPVLTGEVYGLARRVALSCAASVSDVLALAVPQRHARAEKAHLAGEAPELLELPEAGAEPGPWTAYRGGAAFIRRIAAGEGPRAVCCALPGRAGGADAVATAVRAARVSGRGALVVVPSARQAQAFAEALRAALGESVAVVVSEDAHERRYATFLRILSGHDRIVVGTRSAVWAPVRDLGLCAVLDDAAPSLREVRSPYCQTGEVAALRAAREKAALLVLSPYVSLESALLVERGDAALVAGEPAAIRDLAPRASTADQWARDGEQWSRIPESAFALVREGLTRGPVLVAVPRAGYIPLVSCASCGQPAVCPECSGRLGLAAGAAGPVCGRCGRKAASWRCPACGGGRLRSARIGSHRTAEEVGRAFPGTGILLSGAQTSEGIVERVSAKPRLVVATPGAEPPAEGGYAAALLLDSRYLRGEGPGSQIEFLRRVTRIAALVCPGRQGGHVLFAGGAEPGVAELLGSWAMPEFARGLLAERKELQLPPYARWLAVSGRPGDVRSYLGSLRAALLRMGLAQDDAARPQADALLAGGVVAIAPGFSLLGPVPGRREGEITVYVRTGPKAAEALSETARSTYRQYTGKQIGAPLRLEVNPLV